MNKWRNFSWLVVLMLGSVVGQAAAQVSQAEREALIDLYHATDGDNWHDNDDWLGEEGSECDWFGVQCYATEEAISNVRILDLSTNGLTGELPESLAELTELAFLRLRGNAIEGPIPATFGNFGRLSTIDLRGNHLSGPVPGELLATPAHRIWLAGNRLDGFTPVVGTPGGDPVTVDLSRNPISTLPPASWRSAGTISRLELAHTALTGELDFDNHPWPGLGDLNLANNAITVVSGIDAATLTDLRWLNLNGNELTEQWPVSGLTLPSLHVLDLTDNNLRTAPPTDLSEHPNLRELHLAHNALEGEMISELFLLPNLRYLGLQHNPLKTLPSQIPSAVAPQIILDVSHTSLDGTAPDWFGDLSLATLNLSGNRLDGDITAWLAAMRQQGSIRLDLSNNRFEGPLPAELADFNYFFDSLDVCWNDFDEPFGDPLDELLESVHFGGHPADCNGRELADIDPTISGSWYNPERVGKGYTVMLLDSGQLLYYWFGYPAIYTTDPNHQKWAFQMVRPDGAVADHSRSLAPHGGRFNAGLGGGTLQDHDDRRLRMVRRAGDGLSIVSRLRPISSEVIVDPPPPPIHERFDHVRLTELAGTTCDNQSPFQHLSGLWYNPEREGEGFVLEVLPDDRALVYWFTYRPDATGRPAWMIGDGPLRSNIIGTPPPDFPVHAVDIDLMIQPVGTVSGPGFEGDDIDYVEWGSLRLEFYIQGTARVFWDSNLDGYGSGDYPIERLARPMLAECE